MTKSYWFVHSRRHGRETVNGPGEWERNTGNNFAFFTVRHFELSLGLLEARSLISFLSQRPRRDCLLSEDPCLHLFRIFRRVCVSCPGIYEYSRFGWGSPRIIPGIEWASSLDGTSCFFLSVERRGSNILRQYLRSSPIFSIGILRLYTPLK